MTEQVLQNVYDTVQIPILENNVARFGDSTGWTYGSTSTNLVPVGGISPNDGTRTLTLSKRPGIDRVTNFNSTMSVGVVTKCAANIAITALNDVYVCAIWDSTATAWRFMQYRPITGTVLEIGNITTGVGEDDQVFLTELTIANVPNVGIIWNKADGTTSRGFYSAGGATGFTAGSITNAGAGEITDVDFPPKRVSPLPLTGGMVQMNGTTYVMTVTGEIANSDLNTITAWTSTNTIQAISYPDQGVALVRYKHHIVAFGEDSIEFFNDVGNPIAKSPLARTDQAFIKFGCITPKSCVVADDQLYWLGRSTTGTVGLWKLDGYTPTKISGSTEDRQIIQSQNAYGRGCIGQLTVLSIFGQKNILIGGAQVKQYMWEAGVDTTDTRGVLAVNNRGILAYNIDAKLYWGVSFSPMDGENTTYGGGTYLPFSCSQFQLNNDTPSTQYFLFGTDIALANLGQTVYSMDAAFPIYSDKSYNTSTVPYPVAFQTTSKNFGTEKRKRVHRYKLLMDYVYSLLPNTDTGSMLWLGWNKFTGQPQGASQGTVMRSQTIPNTFNRYYVSNLGQGRDWQFGMLSRNLMPMTIRGIELDLSQAAS